MRRPELHQRTRGDLEISMTPMIDVVFLLLEPTFLKFYLLLQPEELLGEG